MILKNVNVKSLKKVSLVTKRKGHLTSLADEEAKRRVSNTKNINELRQLGKYFGVPPMLTKKHIGPVALRKIIKGTIARKKL
jgi:hypothetical protein